MRNLVLLFVIIGVIFGYWFYAAAQFADGNDLDFAQRSFLPVRCSVSTDNTDVLTESAQAYFWNGNARLDFQTNDPDSYSGHEVATASGMHYQWLSDLSQGIVSPVDEYHIRVGIAAPHSWRCVPWLLPSGTAFLIPSAVRFNEE